MIEKARINDTLKFVYDVLVYNSEIGCPHFHFNYIDFKLSILIPTVDEWSQNKDLYISESSNGSYNWEGLRKEKRELINWMDLPNKYDPNKTNVQFIRLQWNVLNSDNKNVKQIKNIQ